jgi:hypothetical protein
MAALPRRAFSSVFGVAGFCLGALLCGSCPGATPEGAPVPETTPALPMPAILASAGLRPIPHPAAVFAPADDKLLDECERAAFQYFVEQAHPVTGLVRDRARADGSPSEGKASIAAVGFGLSAWVIATERGWTDRATAVQRCRTTLRFLADHAPRVHGFFYHFMEMDTGARAWQCELSTIDTGYLLAGALLAREYFRDPEITALANRLYHDVDWQWFLNNGRTFALGWHDETGFSRFRWSQYSELMMLTLLGLGATAKPVDTELWQAWDRKPDESYASFHYIQGAPLFVHQYTQAYVDFRGLRDAYADYFRNSVLATLAQRQFCLSLRGEFPEWNEQLWGVTASDSANGYKAWGGPPRTLGFNALDGTVVPCAAAGSLPFAPRETMAVLRNMRTTYGDRIWKRYGFVDSFNPHTGWVGPDVIGIDLGITLLQAENARSGLVWAVFGQAPEIQSALARAGFLPQARDLPRETRDEFYQLAARAWEAVVRSSVSPDTAGLQLSAFVAAQALGLITGAEAESRAADLLRAMPPPRDSAGALAQYAAGLVTLRHALPSLAGEATRLLGAIDWSKLAISPLQQLGSLDRLAVFFQVAAGARSPSAWTALMRLPERVQSVYVLAPARLRDQLLPGLWLDERAIITGASAAQLAYAQAIEPGAYPHDVLTTALLIEHFPAVVYLSLRSVPYPVRWLEDAPVADQAALLLSVANLLAPDSVRNFFQQDPLVQAGRAAIAEFKAEDFGANSSVFWRRELAGPPKVPPRRETVALPADTPRDQWRWVAMAGLEYKDSGADVRPGDPALSMRFAFTWDQTALNFHAEVTDELPKFTKPSSRCGVELFLTPDDGFSWGRDDNHFGFRTNGWVIEWLHQRAVDARVQPTVNGYNVEARIAWSELGVIPHSGLQLGVSPAVLSEGTRESEPSLKLNWRFYRRPDERYGLGTLRLQ